MPQWIAITGLVADRLVLLAHPAYAVLVVGVVIDGLALGGLMPLWGALLGRCYGRQAFGRVMGLMLASMGPILWAVYPFMGWVRDRTGNYDFAFVVLLAALLLAGVMLMFLHPPAHEPGRDLDAAIGEVPDEGVVA